MKNLHEKEKIMVIYAKCFNINFRDIRYKLEIEFEKKIKKIGIIKEKNEEDLDLSDKSENEEEKFNILDDLNEDLEDDENLLIKGVIPLPLALNKFLKYSGLTNFLAFKGKWNAIDTFNIIIRRFKIDKDILRNQSDLKKIFVSASYLEQFMNIDNEVGLKTRVFGICEVMILKRIRLYFRVKISENLQEMQMEYGFDLDENMQKTIFIKKVIDKILDTYQRLFA